MARKSIEELSDRELAERTLLAMERVSMYGGLIAVLMIISGILSLLGWLLSF